MGVGRNFLKTGCAQANKLKAVAHYLEIANVRERFVQNRQSIQRCVLEAIAVDTADMVMIIWISIKSFLSPADLQLLNLSQCAQDL